MALVLVGEVAGRFVDVKQVDVGVVVGGEDLGAVMVVDGAGDVEARVFGLILGRKKFIDIVIDYF